ncbi:hypothetical protein BOTBODRAFT_189351 [Botryobasidium botryosum FD-172 SS1]|uniref:Uncharacterized protein n=1 Tax=Botryobasidium botryosum (strain FD-172 SS1) TaxID=930990 RepID=A0A067M9E7_BOTB1|nr:hypothetical protein BOTBODRAFT_189351 [Botryobasidium botryosum FD-172 SS1]
MSVSPGRSMATPPTGSAKRGQGLADWAILETAIFMFDHSRVKFSTNPPHFLITRHKFQSTSLDRYVWGSSVLSRLITSLILTALLGPLNIGPNQDYSLDEDSDGPPVWSWLDVLWAIPMLAIALGLQGFIYHVLLYYAVKAADAAAPVDPIFSSEPGYPLQKLHTAESDYSYNPVSPGTAKEDEAFENESSRLKTMWNK